jgi:hypothetical protein
MLNQSLKLSHTVEQVQQKLIDEKAVFAIDIVQLIIERHPEYANNAAPMSLVPNERNEQKHIDDWLTDVRKTSQNIKGSEYLKANANEHDK